MKVGQIGFPSDWISSVSVRGIKDDVKIFGVNDWKDEVVINQDETGEAILSGQSRNSVSDILSLRCV